MEGEIYKLMLHNTRVALLTRAKELGIKNMDNAKKLDMATAIVNYKPEPKKIKPRLKTPTASVADSASIVSEPVSDFAGDTIKRPFPPFTYTSNQIAKIIFFLYSDTYTSEWLLLKQIYHNFPEFIQISGNHTSLNDKNPHLTIFTGFTRNKHNVLYHISIDYKNGKWLYKNITTFDKATNAPKIIADFINIKNKK